MLKGALVSIWELGMNLVLTLLPIYPKIGSHLWMSQKAFYIGTYLDTLGILLSHMAFRGHLTNLGAIHM